MNESGYAFPSGGFTSSHLLRVRADAVDAKAGLDGWCSDEKSSAIVSAVLATGAGTNLEIGVFAGSSFLPIAVASRAAGAKAVGVDPWEAEASLEEMTAERDRAWWGGLGPMSRFQQQCQERLDRLNLGSVGTLVKARSEDLTDEFVAGLGPINVLSIDGNHSEKHSLHDARRFLPLVRTGGYVFYDDVSWVEGGVLTTSAGLVHLLSGGCRKLGMVGDCAVLIKE